MAQTHNATEEQMKPATPSQNLLSLGGADFVGKTLVGHPAKGRPRTLGTITRVTDHTESTVIQVEKEGSTSGIALQRAYWAYTEEAVLIDLNTPTSEDGTPAKRYVRYSTKPSMPAVQVS